MKNEYQLKFEHYAWFSTQVDQYYAAVRVFSRNHLSLKDIFNQSNISREEIAKLPESSRGLVVRTISQMNYMATTGIFNEASYPELEHLPVDMINFGFYTCYCFQWTLFENYISSTIYKLSDEGNFSSEVVSKLNQYKTTTFKRLQYIDSGSVFGKTPFQHLLFRQDGNHEPCDFKDLNDIRELRNKFIHGVENQQIMDISESEKESLYTRSMWVLRHFSSNTNHLIQKLIEN